MKIYVVLVILIIAFIGKAIGQAAHSQIWKALSSVSYKVSEDEYGELYIPEFSEDAKELEGKEVTVSGYIIPFDGLFKPEHVIVSSLPLASCFFCGSGGPETVMEVYLTSPVEYTETLVAFKGKLKLNGSDYEKLMYMLEDAEFIGKVDP